jgi:hypothetical protein
MTDVIGISKFVTELIRTSYNRLDALTDGVPMGEKNNDDQTCIG